MIKFVTLYLKIMICSPRLKRRIISHSYKCGPPSKPFCYNVVIKSVSFVTLDSKIRLHFRSRAQTGKISTPNKQFVGHVFFLAYVRHPPDYYLESLERRHYMPTSVDKYSALKRLYIRLMIRWLEI